MEDNDAIYNASTCKRIFVGGIPAKTNFMLLRNHFSRYGNVNHCFVSPYKSHGYVTFDSEESVRKAIAKPIQFISGMRVQVKEYFVNKRYVLHRIVVL